MNQVNNNDAMQEAVEKVINQAVDFIRLDIQDGSNFQDAVNQYFQHSCLGVESQKKVIAILKEKE